MDLGCLHFLIIHISAAKGEFFFISSALLGGHVTDKVQCKQGNYSKLWLAGAVLFLNLFQPLEEPCKPSSLFPDLLSHHLYLHLKARCQLFLNLVHTGSSLVGPRHLPAFLKDIWWTYTFQRTVFSVWILARFQSQLKILVCIIMYYYSSSLLTTQIFLLCFFLKRNNLCSPFL